ncbi:Prolyl oligopeptidase family protein [Paenibacillus sp. CF384]|nr:prolyl oligopeptidase family serine peptidase [Paenibacillus sp. CF384]SDX06277.1 Prolyl oligopeptidase family protein [Paenibacillus sp. CF384]
MLIGTMDIKPKAIVSCFGHDILGEWATKPSEHFRQQYEIVDKQSAYQFIGEQEITNGQWEERGNLLFYCFQQGVWVNEVSGFDPANDYHKLTQYSPIHNITAEYPPTLFLHGDQDKITPYEQSVMMYKKLQEHGVYTELITIEGVDHDFDRNFMIRWFKVRFKMLLIF